MKACRLPDCAATGQQRWLRWALVGALLAGAAPAMAQRDAVPASLPVTLQGALTILQMSSNSANGHLLLHADELHSFYAQRAWQPRWHTQQARDDWAAALHSLAEDGLNPTWYLQQVAQQAGSTCAEIAMTRAWLQALLDLRFGALDRALTEPLWRYQPVDAMPARQALLQDAATLSLPASLDMARPNLPVYTALSRHLQQLDAEGHADAWPKVPAGALLKPGSEGARVVALRARLTAVGLLAAPEGTPGHSDTTLFEAVRRFQHAHNLATDGIVGVATLTALNRSRDQRRDQLRANLERWRWLREEQFPQQVVVDVAAADIRYFRDGMLRWQARATVGQALRQTPSLRSAITHFTLNPAWTVPPTILRRDKLPAIRANLGYLQEQNLRVLDTGGHEIDPTTVDWNRPGAIILRQAPGPGNALGQVAIRFPNPFSVYLHDTPSRALFQRAQRTDSSGCVRVENALSLVEELLDANQQLDPEDLQRRLNSGKTSDLALLAPISLLIDYWTASIDDSGAVVLRSDHYQRDEQLAAALALRAAPSQWLLDCAAPAAP